MEIWGITDSGKVRQHNQDVFKVLYDEEKKIAVMVVCDGMGGVRGGNVASTLAAEYFMRHMGKYIEDIGHKDDIAAKMADAVQYANVAVFEKSTGEYAGMGTTMCAAISVADGEVIVNVGDSRVYRISNDFIMQVTKDHSVVEDMIRRGDLTRAQAAKHPNRNLITKALGTGRNVEPDVFTAKMQTGDFLLLCSDGLSNVVADDEILSKLRCGNSVRDSCEQLVETALVRGAPDNVTAVLYKK